MITISVDGIEEVRERFRSLVPRLQDKALRLLAQQVFNDVQNGAGRHKQTGALARSVFMKRDGADWLVGHDLQQAPHARFVVLGTGLHGPKAQKYPIRPKNRKALRWHTGGSGYRFARFVMHPGIKPDDYLHIAEHQARTVHWPRIVNNLSFDFG
jgi:hypothetical protein